MVLKRTLIVVSAIHALLDSCLCLWTGPTLRFKEHGNALTHADFLTLYGLSLKECKEACMARKWCLTAIYKRKYPVCVLLRVETTTMPSRDFVMMTGFAKYHAETPSCGSNNCTVNEACINQLVCKVTECPYPDYDQKTSTLHGNMRLVGSRALIKSLGPSESHEYRVCTNSGEWKQPCASSEAGIQASIKTPSCLASNVANTDTMETDDETANTVTLSTSVSDVYIIALENYPLDACPLTGSLFFASATVNLSSAYEIRALHVNNRPEHCSHRPQTISVRIGDSPSSMQQVDYRTQSGTECMFALTLPARTQEITVMIESDVFIDTLCSLSLFANPAPIIMHSQANQNTENTNQNTNGLSNA